MGTFEMTGRWEEIHGFVSPGEYERFCAYIDGQIAGGIAEERSPDAGYDLGQTVGGRWFVDLATADIWRLVAPDFPFRGIWERVEPARDRQS
jgi:hypothetical protein